MVELRLTDNEKGVLKFLIRDGRASCSDIARFLGITPQAVVKIKRKLEQMGIIKGYSAEVDCGKLGAQVFALICYNINMGGSKEGQEQVLRERMKADPFMLRLYRIPTGTECTHVGIFAFRNMDEMGEYVSRARKAIRRDHLEDNFRILKIHIIPFRSLLKDDAKGFLLKIVGELGGKPVLETPFD